MDWVWTIVLNTLLFVAAYHASASLFRQPRGPALWLSTGVLAWTWVTLGMQLLGVFGLINRWSMLVWGLAGLAVALGARFSRSAPDAPDEPLVPPSRWNAPALLSLGLALWVCLKLGLPSLMLPVKVVSDGPIYHLYFAVRWWKSGSIDLIPTPFGETAATYFPANGELTFLWLLTGLGGDLLAKMGQAPFLLLATASSYALARRLGASSSASLTAACWFATSSPLLIFSFEPNVDTFVTAGYLLCSYFLVQFSTNTADRRVGLSSLILSGLSAGLALGTKPTSVVFIPPLLVLGLATILSKRAGTRPAIAQSAVFLLSSFLPSFYWFARNAILTGNPLYPAQVRLFGWTVWPGWYPRSAMRYSPYYVPGTNFGFLTDTLLSVFDARLAPLWLAALGGIWAIGRSRKTPEDRWIWILSFLAVLNVVFYWVVIPYRTQQRFMLPAVGLAAVPLARLIDRSRVLSWLAVGLLALHVLTPWDWPGVPHLSRITPASASLLGIPVSLSDLLNRFSDPRQAILFLSVLLSGPLAVLSLFLWARWNRSRTPARSVAAICVSLLAVAVASSNSWPPPGTRWPVFPFFPSYLEAWTALDYYTGSRGATVAYAGTDIPYYLFGKNLKNDVVYVNIDDHPSWLMHDYQSTALDRGEPPLWDTPRPGWGRLQGDMDAWLHNLSEAGVDYLVVARCRTEQGPFNLADPEDFSLERVWAEGNPSLFSPVYGVFPPDPEMKVFRFHREKIARIDP